MAKKLYYTNPLHAAIMAQEFGVDFCDTDGNKLVYATADIFCYANENVDLYQNDIFYIHPDSCHIFEPQEGDFGINRPCGRECYHSRDGWEFETYETHKPVNVNIIYRNNKHFFMPEVEDGTKDNYVGIDNKVD